MRIQLKIQSVRLKRKLNAVFLRVESQPSKIEIFFLKNTDSIFSQPPCYLRYNKKYYYQKMSTSDQVNHPETVESIFHREAGSEVIYDDIQYLRKKYHPFTPQQEDAICEYAHSHQLSIDDALDYLSSCHHCGKSVYDIFDGTSHNYCNSRCQSYCEDFHYPCFRNGPNHSGCKVCPPVREDINSTRLTCEYVPDEYDSEYDYDSLMTPAEVVTCCKCHSFEFDHQCYYKDSHYYCSTCAYSRFDRKIFKPMPRRSISVPLLEASCEPDSPMSHFADDLKQFKNTIDDTIQSDDYDPDFRDYDRDCDVHTRSRCDDPLPYYDDVKCMNCGSDDLYHEPSHHACMVYCSPCSKLLFSSKTLSRSYYHENESSSPNTLPNNIEELEQTSILEDDDAEDLSTDPDLLAFNTIYNAEFSVREFQAFRTYTEATGLNYSDAFIYSGSCHCCAGSDFLFGKVYCSERCREAIEDHGHTCIRNSIYEECLICDNSGRVYDDNCTPPDFLQIKAAVCSQCKVSFRYPHFDYYEYEWHYEPTEEDLNDPNFDIHDIGNNQHVCHSCFCEKSTAKREFRDNFPINDLPCHHPVVSTVHMFKELGLYNTVDDLQVWSDLSEFIGK